MAFKIHYFQRKRRANQNFSLEFIFEDLRSRLKNPFIHHLYISRFLSNGLFRRLYNLIEPIFQQGDVNHVTGDINYVAIGLKKSKTVLTILDVRFLESAKGFKAYLFKYLWVKWPIERSKLVTVISKSTKEQILKYVDVDASKIIVIPVAISERFKYVPKKFENTNPIILQVGTAPNKNIERLLEAIYGIKCTLFIVGKISATLQNKLDEYKINFQNFVNISDEEIRALYEQCDIVSFVSTYEGFGMPILEGNAVGRAVITSNLLSMPEVAGNAACIVNPYDIEDIRSGILKIINSKAYRDKLIFNGLENVKRFSPEMIAQMYMDVYKRILNNE